MATKKQSDKLPIAHKVAISNDYPMTDKQLIRNYLSRLKGSEAHLVKVRDGDIQAIQELLEIASDGIRVGAPLTREIAEYISSALYKISQGEKADLAFGIKRKRGQKNLVAEHQKNYYIAEDIQLRRLACRETLEEAIEKIAERENIPSDTAKDAWKKFHKQVMEDWPFSTVIPKAKKKVA
jgi:hypothetical protein